MILTNADNINLKRGDLVIPIVEPPVVEQSQQMIKVFVPFGCDDDSMETVALCELYEDFKSDIFGDIWVEGYAITVEKGDNFVSLKANHGITAGDYIVVRGKSYRVMVVTDDDCFYPEGTRNIIRIYGSFENNCTRQRLRFRQMPLLRGKLFQTEFRNLTNHKNVEIKFKQNKNNRNNHGNAEITFNNAIFNSSGYFTHDRAIVYI